MKRLIIALTLMTSAAHAEGLTSSYVEPEITPPAHDRDFYVGCLLYTSPSPRDS